jgi:hypothetical protein
MNILTSCHTDCRIDYCRPDDDPAVPWEKVVSQPDIYFDVTTHGKLAHALDEPRKLSVESIYLLAEDLKHHSNISSPSPFRFFSSAPHNAGGFGVSKRTPNPSTTLLRFLEFDEPSSVTEQPARPNGVTWEQRDAPPHGLTNDIAGEAAAARSTPQTDITAPSSAVPADTTQPQPSLASTVADLCIPPVQATVSSNTPTPIPPPQIDEDFSNTSSEQPCGKFPCI